MAKQLCYSKLGWNWSVCHNHTCFLVHSVMNYTRKHRVAAALIMSRVQINVLCDVIIRSRNNLSTLHWWTRVMISHFSISNYVFITWFESNENLKGWKEASWRSGQIFLQTTGTASTFVMLKIGLVRIVLVGLTAGWQTKKL